ncbi:MAG: MMPL family transporter [Chloroflexi bacterium]|nr:MMPL family transporter [Chloroflexota bacterium]
MTLSPESLARSAALRPWRTIAVWLTLVAVSMVLVGTLLGSATSGGQGEFTSNPESKRAQELLEKSGLRGELQDTEIIVVSHETLTADSDEFKAKVADVHAKLVALGPEVLDDPAAVPNPFALPAQVAESFISANRNHVRIPATLAGGVLDAQDRVEGLLKLADEESVGGFTVGVAGAAAINADFQEISERDLILGETIGVIAALFILIIVFRAFGSVWFPLVIAIMGIVMTYAAIAVIGQFYDNFPFFVTNFVTMIGLAVGIDYTLFIVARYKEERAHGREKIDAIVHSGATASRAVLFSGFTVVFALVGMLIVPTTIFFSMALGAILVVVFTVLLALIFLPALLSILGDRVNAWKMPGLRGSIDYENTTSGFWNWITRTVLRRPLIFMAITLALLIALVIPYFSINLGFNGVETLPGEFRARQTFDILINEFEGGQGLGDVSAVDLVIDRGADTQAARDAIGRLDAILAADPAFGAVGEYEVSPDGQVGLLPVLLAVAGDSDEATRFIRKLRGDYLPAAAFPADPLVGGVTAFSVDFFNLVDDWTPIVLALVLSLSFVLLMVVFRSVIVPIKAIILNLLSVGAAYGLLVLVFQEGFLIDVLGFQQVPVIEAWIPLFLFAILFGLSMDYEVFLLSRIKEHFDQTGDNSESVAFGLRSTASIITGAALIMVAVFWGFTLGDLVMFQQFGFGLAVAILVDATIIRSILVPSTMKLLGKNNWWLPGFLNWLPDLRVEGGESHRQSGPAAETVTHAD